MAGVGGGGGGWFKNACRKNAIKMQLRCKNFGQNGLFRALGELENRFGQPKKKKIKIDKFLNSKKIRPIPRENPRSAPGLIE